VDLFLTVSFLSILDPFVKLMGFIINYIYKFLLLFGITKVAVCIIVFTIVIKLVTLPLTYKQQKFSKVSAKMNPEIQAISEKYKGKKDQESMTKMQMEQQEVYKKYGASPMSGCFPMIVLMVILFALYPVIYSIPTYVDEVQTYYSDIVTVLMTDDSIPEKIVVDSEGTVVATAAVASSEDGTTTYNFADAIYSFYKINNVYVRKAPDYDGTNTTTFSKANLIAIMADFSGNDWDEFFNAAELTSSKYDAVAWNVYAPYISEALSKTTVNSDGETVYPSEIKEEIVNLNTFLGLNIFDKPSDMMSSSNQVTDSKALNYIIALSIPVLAALLQFLQTRISMALNKTDDKKKKKKSTEPDPMDSMKTMNVIMPIFSGIICFSLPIGVGIYWITSALISIILQLIINAKLKNIDIQVFVDESEVRNKKNLEKQGVHTDNDGSMASVAKTSTRGISSKASYNNSGDSKNNNNTKKDYVIPEEKRHLKASSISQIANIYNENYDTNTNSDDVQNEDSDKEEK
jgi:YidC/Oxa1 family membrane protein insertase